MIRTRKPFALLHTGLILLLFALYACGKTYQDDTAFNDKITLLENHPEAILAQPDSTDFSRITTEKEATAFLLRSLARHYTSRDFYPEKEKLQECIRIFRSRNKVQQELEALFLLAETCKKENNTAEEIAAIEQGMKLAELADDPVWKFHLYNYLSDMYLRKYDMLKFIKNQALANQSIKEKNTDELDPAGKKLSVYRPACQSRNFTDPAQDIGQPATHLLHGYMPAAGNYLLQAEEMGKRCN